MCDGSVPDLDALARTFGNTLDALPAPPTHDEYTVAFPDGTTVTRDVARYREVVDRDGTYHPPYEIVAYVIRDARGSVTDVTQRYVSRAD